LANVQDLHDPLVRLLDGPRELAEFAAHTMAAEIQHAVTARGEAVVALPGGTTPRAALEILAELPGVDWARVVLIPGDERMVPVTDPDSNEGMIRAALVSRIAGPTPLLVGWEVEEGIGPETVVAQFETRLLGVVPTVDGRLQIDWVGLGMGPDGHTASLFPGREYPEDRLALATIHPSGQRRLSLGPSLLRAAARVRFLLEGEAKAAVLAEVLEGAYDPVRLPAQLVARRALGCEVWCDRAAAGRLSKPHAG
jgi:6-phosphogluconolactonase